MGKATAAAGGGPAAADPRELERFGALAARFWDAGGPMRPLHLMNPLRLRYILDRARELGLAAPEEGPGAAPLSGVRALDAGCGAGLLAEPLARLGAAVTGLDAQGDLIEAAREHAAAAGLEVAYEVGTPDDLLARDGAPPAFDLVTALEVVEHVPDRHAFVSGLAQLTRPGGLVVLSTIARTARSAALAIGAAEYLLGLLPRGTHDWRRFVSPSELARELRDAGLRPVHLAGVAFEPAYERFRLTRDARVNYLMAAVRA